MNDKTRTITVLWLLSLCLAGCPSDEGGTGARRATAARLKPGPGSVGPNATVRDVLTFLRTRDSRHTGWVLPAELMRTKIRVVRTSDAGQLWRALRDSGTVTVRRGPSGVRVALPKGTGRPSPMAIFPRQPRGTWGILARREAPSILRLQAAAPRDIVALLRQASHAAISPPPGSDPHARQSPLTRPYSVSLPEMPLAEALLLLGHAWHLDVSVVDGRIIFGSPKGRKKEEQGV